MYLAHLKLSNVKLLRELELSFLRDGEPRMWTVFLGENGLCKSTLLQAIALAASGPERANQLAEVRGLCDARVEGDAEIHAVFGFSDRYREDRTYPGLEHDTPAAITSTLWARRGVDVVTGVSGYSTSFQSPVPPTTHSPPHDRRYLYPLSEARAQNLPLWFTAGYGPFRNLAAPFSVPEPSDPARQRLETLFENPGLIGTAFADLFPQERVRAFTRVLRQVFVDMGVLPHIENIELRGQGGVRDRRALIESHRFDICLGREVQQLPATWLSQGYKSTIAWIADLIGQVWWEADDAIGPEDMEGLVLVDEIDLHLHPRWQASFVRSLKRAFPRLQFIATTHSPMLLPGLEQDELIVLELNEGGNVVPRPADVEPRFLTSAELLEVFFGIDSAMPDELENDLRCYGFLANNPYRSDAEDAEMDKLRVKLEAAGVRPMWEPVPRQQRAPGA